MKKTTLGILAGLAIVLLIGGLSLIGKSDHDGDTHMSEGSFSSQQDTSEDDLTAEAEISMDITDFAFSRSNIKVKKGTKITWTNQDDAKHNAFSDDKSGPRGELLGKGESYSFVFDNVGSFAYYCEPHPYMKGTVNVVE